MEGYYLSRGPSAPGSTVIGSYTPYQAGGDSGYTNVGIYSLYGDQGGPRNPVRDLHASGRDPCASGSTRRVLSKEERETIYQNPYATFPPRREGGNQQTLQKAGTTKAFLGAPFETFFFASRSSDT